MKLQSSIRPLLLSASFVFSILLTTSVDAAPISAEPARRLREKVRSPIGKRIPRPKKVVRLITIKPSDPAQVIALSARSLRETVCKDLFNLKATTPDALLVSPEVKISFVDLSRTEIAPGQWGKVVGISGGTSGTVVVEQPDGKTFYSERQVAERTGMKIIRVVQGPGGRIRIHKDLSPVADAAFVLNHELGHVADKMFGPDASMIIDDAATTAEVSKELHRTNEKTMAGCKAGINRL